MHPVKTQSIVLAALLLTVLGQGSGHASEPGTVPLLQAQHDTGAEEPSFSGEATWQNFHSESEGFSVVLPGSPKLISGTTRTLLGPVKETAYRVRNRLGEFTVELHELPGISALLAPSRLVIGRARDSLLANRSAEQLSFQMIKGEDYPHGIVTYRSADTKFEIEEIHLVMAGRRLFVLIASLLEAVDRPSMERFFNSFRVSERSK